MPVSHDDPELLQAALVGYRHQLAQIEAKMAEIRSLLAGHPVVLPSESFIASGVPKRELSDEARERIAAAQRRRWKAYNMAKAAAAKAKKAAPVKSSKSKAAQPASPASEGAATAQS
ncbi:MAG TPA: hypothetical protein VF767_04965 [Bryobacteraceae bacterium]